MNAFQIGAFGAFSLIGKVEFNNNGFQIVGNSIDSNSKTFFFCFVDIIMYRRQKGLYIFRCSVQHNNAGICIPTNVEQKDAYKMQAT